MLNWIGRIILLAVAACFVGFSIFPLINSIEALNSIGWDYNASMGSVYYASFVINAVTILAAVPALFAGLTGKAGFWLFLVAALLIGAMVYFCIIAGQAGYFTGWEAVLEIVKGFAFPIAYVVGAALVLFAKKKEN